MIHLASEIPPRSERTPIAGSGEAAVVVPPVEGDGRLRRMRQTRSRLWPFRSMPMAEPAAPFPTPVAAERGRPAPSLQPGFSA